MDIFGAGLIFYSIYLNKCISTNKFYYFQKHNFIIIDNNLTIKSRIKKIFKQNQSFFNVPNLNN